MMNAVNETEQALSIRWSTADIADAVEAGLRARAQTDDLEQAVYGFDALDELRLHPLIHAALRRTGCGVWPEQRYPNDRERSRKSEGRRCDVVLTPSPDLPLRDPELRGTLFAAQAACDPEDAYWLEVKTVAQYETGGPFHRYSAELLAPVTADVRKLWTDGLIRYAGLLLVLFTEEQAVAEHDLSIWHQRCLDKGFPVAHGAVRGFAINNRIGNGWCAVGVYGVRGV
jgi:hypothetical protein